MLNYLIHFFKRSAEFKYLWWTLKRLVMYFILVDVLIYRFKLCLVELSYINWIYMSKNIPLNIWFCIRIRYMHVIKQGNSATKTTHHSPLWSKISFMLISFSFLHLRRCLLWVLRTHSSSMLALETKTNAR